MVSLRLSASVVNWAVEPRGVPWKGAASTVAATLLNPTNGPFGVAKTDSQYNSPCLGASVVNQVLMGMTRLAPYVISFRHPSSPILIMSKETPVPSFGLRLKQEREQRGISLEEISQSTKISTRLLHALEDEHFDQLPGGIFNKGFIRAYAHHLGLDEEEVVADYIAATAPPVPEKKSAAAPQPSAQVWPDQENDAAAGLPWEAFAVVLLLAALGFAGWGFYSREKHKDTRPAPVKHEESSLPAPMVPAPQPTAALIPASTQPTPSVTSTAQTTTPSATPANLKLHIKIEDDSWVAVTADGKEVSRGTFTAPTERTVEASKTIIVKAGNIGGLDFEFNGKKLPPQGDYDEVKTLVFDANGVRIVPPKTDVSSPQP